MQHRRTDGDALVQRIRNVSLDRQASLLVEERDVCFLQVDRKLSEKIPPGTWVLGHVPLQGWTLESGAVGTLTFVRTDRYRTLKLGGRLTEGDRFFGTVSLRVEPDELYMNLLLDPNDDADGYIEQVLTRAMKRELDVLVAEHGPARRDAAVAAVRAALPALPHGAGSPRREGRGSR